MEQNNIVHHINVVIKSPRTLKLFKTILDFFLKNNQTIHF